MSIRDAQPGDAAAIAGIYNVYVSSTTVTFETVPVDAPGMARRIAEIQAHGLPWLVACTDGTVCGFANAAPWKARAAYAHTVESSIYLAGSARGRGLGRRLYAALIERLREAGLHTVIGGIALPNPASVRLHEGIGFSRIGVFREVGHKFGGRIDVGYWQLQLAD